VVASVRIELTAAELSAHHESLTMTPSSSPLCSLLLLCCRCGVIVRGRSTLPSARRRR
jgi:hypothetical protein